MNTNRFLSTGAAAVVAVAIGLSLPAPADARDVKSGGGARNNVTSGANRDGNANRNVNTNRNVNANSNTNVNRNTNINRETNVNRNTNVNVNRDRNINVDVNHRGCCDNDWDDHHHPIATGMAIGATAAITSAVIGSMVTTLPPACTTTVINGIGYSNCGGTWYQPQYVGTSVQYVVVTQPR
jgi:hypothetical protein